MLPQLGGPCAPKAAVAASVGAVSVATVVVVPEDDDPSWFAALAVVGVTLAAVAAISVIADSVRRRRLARRSPDLSLPEWAPTLPEPWFCELESRFLEFERRLHRADQAALESRRRASRSLGGMWHLIAAAVNSEERARGRFVADLHDSVVQTLVVSTYLAEDEDTPREVLAENMREAERQLRDLMVNARPADLRRNLGIAARALSRVSLMRHDLVVEWEWPAHEAELPASVANTLYRFWQEGLANVAKHANVKHARAGLRLGSDIEAWVEDEGAGFDPDEVPPTAADASAVSGHHVGLGLMRDRAQQIGARTEVVSAPGKGTRVTMTLPYPPTHVERTVEVGDRPPMLDRGA